MRPGRTAPPTPRSGPGPRRTRDWGRRTSRPRRVGCEIVASTRCPSLWPNVILKKSHSPTTTGHFDVKTHPRPSPDRCIQAKNRGCFAFDVSMVVVMPVVDVVVIRRLLRLVDDRRRCTVFGGAETRSLRLQPAQR